MKRSIKIRKRIRIRNLSIWQQKIQLLHSRHNSIFLSYLIYLMLNFQILLKSNYFSVTIIQLQWFMRIMIILKCEFMTLNLKLTFAMIWSSSKKSKKSTYNLMKLLKLIKSSNTVLLKLHSSCLMTTQLFIL